LGDVSATISHRHREGILSAISVGFFFILAGTIFLTTSNLLEKVTDFFQSQNWETILVPNTQVNLPVPIVPSSYVIIYQAIGLFSLVWAFFEIAMLVMRILAGSPLRRKVDNVSDVAFWLGAYYLIGTHLTVTVDQSGWFAFWSLIIVLIGVTFLIRAALWAALALRNP
jgi:hypothetical protein